MAGRLFHFSIAILALVIRLSYAVQGDEEDYVPDFFGGRRDDGIAPPPPPATTRSLADVETKFFTQKLDHTRSSNTATWQQRYMVNKRYYKPGGPIFVLIGGEGTIYASSLTGGQFFNNAKKHNALLFQLEHRFYGESKPTSDVSVANLRYLSSQQALADLDFFIKSMKEEHKIPDAKVVVSGCSYPGSLAAYYRVLYPKSTVGAIASSAPVFAKENFFEYIEVIGSSLKYFSQDCYDSVKKAFDEVDSLLKAKNDARLESTLNLCSPAKIDYSNPNAFDSMHFSLISKLMSMTQYNGVGDQSALAKFCRNMTDASIPSPLERFGAWFKANGGGCVDHSGRGIVTKNETWESSFVKNGYRQWLYQTCAEFGYFMTTDSDNQPFGRKIDLNFLKTMCEKSYGITNVAKNVAFTNALYGGQNPNVTNVFFMNGGNDPWHRLSVYEKDLNPTVPVRLVEGISHCYGPKGKGDPEALTKAWQDVADTITTWLK